MYYNGESLIKKAFIQRRAQLHKAFLPEKGFFQFATYKDLSEPEEITPWLEESVKGNCEGVQLFPFAFG